MCKTEKRPERKHVHHYFDSEHEIVPTIQQYVDTRSRLTV